MGVLLLIKQKNPVRYNVPDRVLADLKMRLSGFDKSCFTLPFKVVGYEHLDMDKLRTSARTCPDRLPFLVETDQFDGSSRGVGIYPVPLVFFQQVFEDGRGRIVEFNLGFRHHGVACPGDDGVFACQCERYGGGFPNIKGLVDGFFNLARNGR